MSSQLVGAWEGGREGWRFITVFTETHYCWLGNAQDRNPFQGDQPSETEEIEAYRTMFASGGTYTVSDSTIAFNEEYDRIPRDPHVQHSFRCEFTIEGDKLTLITPSGNAFIVQKTS